MQARDHQPARSVPVTSRATRSRTSGPSRSSTSGWASALAYQCGWRSAPGHRGHDRVDAAVRHAHERRLAQESGAGADRGQQHDVAPPQADAGALEVLDLLPHPGHGAGLVRPDQRHVRECPPGAGPDRRRARCAPSGWGPSFRDPARERSAAWIPWSSSPTRRRTSIRPGCRWRCRWAGTSSSPASGSPSRSSPCSPSGAATGGATPT